MPTSSQPTDQTEEPDGAPAEEPDGAVNDPEPPSNLGGLWGQAGEQLSDLAVRARTRLRDFAARARTRLRELAAWARPRVQALRDAAAPALGQARDLAVRGSARLRDFAAWARSRIGDLTARTHVRLREFAAWAQPRLQALRDYAAPALRRLRELTGRALVWLRHIAARALEGARRIADWAIPWLRVLRALAARALRRLRELGAWALVCLLYATMLGLRTLRGLAMRGLERLRALGSLVARALRWLRGSVPATAVVLAAIVTMSFLMFVLTEPSQRWLLLLGALAAALGTHGVLRSEHPRTFELGVDTTPQLVLPALYALAIPLFIEENARGLWEPFCAIAAGLGFAAIVVAEVRSVREFERGAGEARLITDGGVYLTAFALLSLLYTRDPTLPAAVATAALVGGLLSFEVLRNSSLGLLDMLTFALVGALVIGELRWALHFVPLDGHLAAVALLLAFFFVSGVLAARLRGQLTREVLIQYGAVAAVGVVVITAARAADLA